MVFTTEGFLEVAIESWPEWNFNPRPLNSVQNIISFRYKIHIYIYILCHIYYRYIINIIIYTLYMYYKYIINILYVPYIYIYI